jgi:uncharacterized damage-inducible protein DinB
MAAVPEPWLRGPIPKMDACVAPILYTFQQAREDLDLYAGSLTAAQLWAKPYGFGSVGFHMLHIAGSTDRLMSYLEGRELSHEQFAALAAEEKTEGLSAAELLAGMDRVFQGAEAVVRAIEPATLSEPRWVGKKRLPTTVAGLLTHIAEHIQRHIGQAISAAKLAQAIDNGPQS